MAKLLYFFRINILPLPVLCRVDLSVIVNHFVMQVISCSVARPPHFANKCSLPKALPSPYGNLAQVSVGSFVAIVVLNDYIVSVASRLPRLLNFPRSRAVNGRPFRRRNINSIVKFSVAIGRVLSVAKTRANSSFAAGQRIARGNSRCCVGWFIRGIRRECYSTVFFLRPRRRIFRDFTPSFFLFIFGRAIGSLFFCIGWRNEFATSLS